MLGSLATRSLPSASSTPFRLAESVYYADCAGLHEMLAGVIKRVQRLYALTKVTDLERAILRLLGKQTGRFERTIWSSTSKALHEAMRTTG